MKSTLIPVLALTVLAVGACSPKSKYQRGGSAKSTNVTETKVQTVEAPAGELPLRVVNGVQIDDTKIVGVWQGACTQLEVKISEETIEKVSVRTTLTFNEVGQVEELTEHFVDKKCKGEVKDAFVNKFIYATEKGVLTYDMLDAAEFELAKKEEVVAGEKYEFSISSSGKTLKVKNTEVLYMKPSQSELGVEIASEPSIDPKTVKYKKVN